jgi:hypothetical protein
MVLYCRLLQHAVLHCALANQREGSCPISGSRLPMHSTALCIYNREEAAASAPASRLSRAVLPWLAWRSAEAHAAELLCSGWRGGALQKRTPPCCCALAGVALCRNARRRAVVLWLAWRRSAETHAAVLLCSGWRGALQKRTPPCCCVPQTRPRAAAPAVRSPKPA